MASILKYISVTPMLWTVHGYLPDTFRIPSAPTINYFRTLVPILENHNMSGVAEGTRSHSRWIPRRDKNTGQKPTGRVMDPLHGILKTPLDRLQTPWDETRVIRNKRPSLDTADTLVYNMYSSHCRMARDN